MACIPVVMIFFISNFFTLKCSMFYELLRARNTLAASRVDYHHRCKFLSLDGLLKQQD